MIALASDHAGLPLKEEIMLHLKERGLPFEDFGTHSASSCDYSDFAVQACEAVTGGKCDKAILVCGTGIGMSMAANKLRGIRAAVASEGFSVKFTRLHNDANVLCLGQRVVGPGLACQLVDLFVDTAFEGGRHQSRIDKVMALEGGA